MIYHITTHQAWEIAIAENNYECESLHSEKFIHCSNANQIQGVLERYYKGVSDLIILCINQIDVAYKLKYELAPSINQVFPHIYGPILPSEVVKTIAVSPNNAWKHEIFIVNAAIQLLPMQPSNLSYPLIDKVIAMIHQQFANAKTTAFNTSVEGTLLQVTHLVEKINLYLLQHSLHCEWLCNVQIHGSNQGDINEAQKIK